MDLTKCSHITKLPTPPPTLFVCRHAFIHHVNRAKPDYRYAINDLNMMDHRINFVLKENQPMNFPWSVSPSRGMGDHTRQGKIIDIGKNRTHDLRFTLPTALRGLTGATYGWLWWKLRKPKQIKLTFSVPFSFVSDNNLNNYTKTIIHPRLSK